MKLELACKGYVRPVTVTATRLLSAGGSVGRHTLDWQCSDFYNLRVCSLRQRQWHCYNLTYLVTEIKTIPKYSSLFFFSVFDKMIE